MKSTAIADFEFQYKIVGYELRAGETFGQCGNCSREINLSKSPIPIRFLSKGIRASQPIYCDTCSKALDKKRRERRKAMLGEEIEKIVLQERVAKSDLDVVRERIRQLAETKKEFEIKLKQA